MDLAWGYGTDARHRGENQDCHGVYKLGACTLAVVCDGMGGHAGGAQASSLAVRTVHDAMAELGSREVREALGESIQRANRTIYETGRKSHRLMGMGTTVVACAITGDTAHIAHVGDSRAYLIRGGQAKQITRDHTMVNMFVDHELLSPEDAASHPEAHVLARSLGVERQVEIEYQEALALEQGDAIVLCSDGVHGVLTDWEFSQSDWRDPMAAVANLIHLVAQREGADNATVVAVTVGIKTSKRAPPTDLPSIERIEDHLTPSSGTPIRAPVLMEPQPPSTMADLADGAAEARPMADHAQGMLPPKVRTRATSEAPPRAQRGRRGNNIAALIVSTIGLVFIGICVVLIVAIFVVVPRKGPSTPQALAGSRAVQSNDAPAQDSPEPTAFGIDKSEWFAPVLPRQGRRLPHRREKWVTPPPGGSRQHAIVEAAKHGECGEAAVGLDAAVAESPDYAVLYSTVWDCYTDRDQQPLAKARATGWQGLEGLLPHFEGNLQAAEKAAKANGAPATVLPHWFKPPESGVELRLYRWTRSVNEGGLMYEVISDHKGDEQVAFDLAGDIILEATAARSLALLQKPPPDAVQAWARRVYWARWAWNGPPGEIVRLYRPEVVSIVEQLLAEAEKGLDGAFDADSKVKPPQDKWDYGRYARQFGLPEVVVQADFVAHGWAPPPDAQPVRPIRSTHSTEKEPQIDLNVPLRNPDGSIRIQGPTAQHGQTGGGGQD